MTAPVFPAAAVADDEHPPLCACLACAMALLAGMAEPLLPLLPLTDPALAGRIDSPTGPVVDTVERRTHQSGPVGAQLGAAGTRGPAAPAPAVAR
ncbi:hypothetical protein [Micromonospora sp. NPDC023633]|uniref:hypothetical protein n=1 Tax=Micromonospora sp. NPDC023633 TaxID=3154320 RepID=UPI0033F81A0E